MVAWPSATNPILAADNTVNPLLQPIQPVAMDNARYGDCISGCSSQVLLYANSTDGLTWYVCSIVRLTCAPYFSASVPVPSAGVCAYVYVCVCVCACAVPMSVLVPVLIPMRCFYLSIIFRIYFCLFSSFL